MKSNKEIELAKKNFLKSFREQKITEIDDSTFIPHNPVIHYSNQKWALLGAITSGLIFIYLAYNAFVIDAVYYWHIDLPVIVGSLIIFIFFILFIFFTNRYFTLDKILTKYIENPNESQYGIVLTKDYFFELTPEAYHIISKDNIIRIDYEEKHTNGDIYVEFLIENNQSIESRGIIYDPLVFDLKKWAKKN